MSVTTAFANQILALIIEATAIPNIADNAASSPATLLYISLHTASPGIVGSQTTSEVAYTGYTRKSVARSAAGWTVGGASDTNDAEVAFPICTGSPGSDITHVGIGLSSSGAGTLLLFGALDSPIAMQTGTTPLISAGELAVVCS